tara:strand:- start:3710 stop:4531 length:822 start_codon:yes stop_codon:yes gene_type:complete
LGKREDGYHNLQTLFQFIDYGDTLHFTLRTDDKIHLSTPGLNLPIEDNLIYKVAQQLKNIYHPPTGIDIRLEKKIPMGAGLGGGSSNAATTLLALNYVWKLNLKGIELMNLAEPIGADVPFFVNGYSAWGEGIGTKLTTAHPQEKYVLVITPPCHIATAKIFQHSELTRGTQAFRIEHLKGLLENELIDSNLKNDFEPLVRKCYPSVAKCLDWLNQYGNAKLSGSGSSIFALFDTKDEAESVMNQVPADFHAVIAKGINKSPTLAQLSNTAFN